MDRQDKISEKMLDLEDDQFGRSVSEIEKLFELQGDKIALETLDVFDRAFIETARLQQSNEKGPVQFFVMSYLYSSICTGSCEVKIDLFDHRFYADTLDIGIYLPLECIYKFLDADMQYFKAELNKHFPRLRQYELELVRYQYIYRYHAIVRSFFDGIIGSLLEIPSFLKLQLHEDFQVLFGGYMDLCDTLWPKKGVVR